MSETPAPTPPVVPDAPQFKVKLGQPTHAGLAHQAEALGFHSENSVGAIWLTACAAIPPHKAFEALAKLQAYHPAPAPERKAKR